MDVNALMDDLYEMAKDGTLPPVRWQDVPTSNEPSRTCSHDRSVNDQQRDCEASSN